MQPFDMTQTLQHNTSSFGMHHPAMAFNEMITKTNPFVLDCYYSFTTAPHELFSSFDRTYGAYSRIDSLVKDSHGCALLVQTYPSSTCIYIAGETQAHADQELKRIDALMETLRPTEVTNTPTFSVWTKKNGDASSKPTKVLIPDWDVMGRNYPKNTRKQLEQLHSLSAPPTGGRIVLMHGAPGTGKTTAIKALVGAWRSWATVEFISDSSDLQDDVFTDSVLSSGASWTRASLDDRMVKTEKWKVVVAEDCDAWLEGAHKERGSHLGQFLNTTDGVSSAGGQAIFIMTTNEPIAKLHPALTRPGRCLAVVEFEKFTPEESRKWLNSPTVSISGDMTLAELYQKDGAFDYFEQDAPKDRAGGVYL